MPRRDVHFERLRRLLQAREGRIAFGRILAELCERRRLLSELAVADQRHLTV